MKTQWFPLIRPAIRALFLGGGSFGGGTLDSHDLLLGGETTYPPGKLGKLPGKLGKINHRLQKCRKESMGYVMLVPRSPYMKKQLIPIVLAVSPKTAGWFPFVGRFGIDCHLIHLSFCVDPFLTQRNLPKNMEKHGPSVRLSFPHQR